jgi:NAD(P)-dependent dehydrogenase (short-subunit alcohol dehydrogenase family)
MSSVSAVRPTPATTAYAASKGGLESLTYAMAIEYAHRGVRVHCVRPGPVGCGMLEAMPPAARDALTARLPTGELIDADQVAKTVVFLLRGEIDHMTEGVVTLDGGYLLG